MRNIIPLSAEQIRMIEENISVIDTVIYKRIIFNNSVFGLEYDDLYQEGCMLICKAAQKYKPNKNCSFKSYAYKVILNGLISHCRRIKRQSEINLIYTEKAKKELATKETADNILQDTIIELDIISFLEDIKTQYSGTARLGIEALAWKVKGFTGAEIAKIYNVKSNNVGAWISRALKKLRTNSVFNIYIQEMLDKSVSVDKK